jgi:hypothetical protein
VSDADEESIQQYKDKVENDEGRQIVGDADEELEATDEESINQYKGEIVRNLKRIEIATQQKNNPEAVKLEMENARLKKHLGSVRNKMWKARKVNGPHEQRRKRISIAIDRAIKNSEKVHPAFAQHLMTHVRTGSDFAYRPAGSASWTPRAPEP